MRLVNLEMGFINLVSLDCSPAYSTGENGMTYVVDSVLLQDIAQSQGSLSKDKLQKRGGIDSSIFNVFKLKMKFTSNHQVDQHSPIWIGFCDMSDKCGSIQTNKQELAAGSVIVNVTDYGTITNGISFNISTTDIIDMNDRLQIFSTEFFLCSADADEYCYGQQQCNRNWDHSAVNETCGWSEKYCAMGQAQITAHLNFADYGVSTIEDTTYEIRTLEKRFDYVSNRFLYAYILYISYSENMPRGQVDFATSNSAYVTVTYSTDQVMVSETLNRFELSGNGLMLHGKSISDVQVKINVAPGTDSITITEFKMCEVSTNICKGIDTCAPTGDENSFDYCPAVTTVILNLI